MRARVIFALLLLAPACSGPRPTISIDGDSIKTHIQKLASDEMQGRAPGGKGEELATTYINDPQLADQTKFGGKAMTYYGRWTYKLEEAARQGAAGALIIHETEFASYPWEVVRGSWSGEQFDIVRPDKGASAVPIQGWITRNVATAMFKSAGLDFEDMKKKALGQDFKPVPLGLTASVDINNEMRRVDSKNVIGVLEGSEKPGEYVIFTAHWDHLGTGEEQNGENIYHGAVDNASGVASMMEIARAAAKLQPRPKRSLVFMAVTGEEQGLLGSDYYADNPIFPLNKTLANITSMERTFTAEPIITSKSLGTVTRRWKIFSKRLPHSSNGPSCPIKRRKPVIISARINLVSRGKVYLRYTP